MTETQVKTSQKNTMLPAACIVAVGLIASALILKTDALSSLFFVPPGPGYQKAADQFKNQMEAGIKGELFGGTQSWEGVDVQSVTFEKNSKSYRVYYAVLLHDVEKNTDFRYESNCPLSANGAGGYSGSCERAYGRGNSKASILIR
jgi:hypothetical protein